MAVSRYVRTAIMNNWKFPFKCQFSVSPAGKYATGNATQEDGVSNGRHAPTYLPTYIASTYTRYPRRKYDENL